MRFSIRVRRWRWWSLVDTKTVKSHVPKMSSDVPLVVKNVQSQEAKFRISSALLRFTSHDIAPTDFLNEVVTHGATLEALIFQHAFRDHFGDV
jgi:hypothetical protein